MKIKNLILLASLLFVSYLSNGQNLLGIKSSVSYSEFTQRSSITILERKLKKNAGEFFSPEISYGIAAVLYLEINKFISFGIEPGFVRTDNFMPTDDFLLVDDAFFNDVYFIFYETPMKMKLQLPLSKNRWGVYTSIGINPIKMALIYVKKNDFQDRELRLPNTSLNTDWHLRNVFGFGTYYNFGKTRFIIDIDLSAPFGMNPFANSISDFDFFTNFGLKELEIGVGYLRSF